MADKRLLVLPPTITTEQHTNHPDAGSSQASGASSIQSQLPRINQVAIAANSSGPNLSAGRVASIFNPTTQVSTPILENSAPIYNWNSQADTFALSAHRFGRTASQIADQLRSNGYDRVIVEEVVASLVRQGVKNPKW